MKDDGRVLIEYGVVPNRPDGWLSLVWINGRSAGDTWSSRGHSKDDAWSIAEAEACEEAARYIGDWEITVRRKEAL